jgi:uncharacterized protein
MTDELPKKIKCGFAAMAPERRRQIAAMGGSAVPAEKRGFAVDPVFAAKVGKLGGKAVPNEKRSFTFDCELAQRAGRASAKSRKAS